MNETYRRGNGTRLEGTALAHHIAKQLRGQLLNVVYMKVKHAGLALRVQKLDGESSHRTHDKDDSRINVELKDGIIVNAWVG